MAKENPAIRNSVAGMNLAEKICFLINSKYRRTLVCGSFFLLVCFSAPSFAGDLGASYNGPTGLMNIPSGNALSVNEQAFSIHRYQLKYTYGFFSLFELGLKTDFDRSTTIDVIAKTISYNFKFKILTEENSFCNASAGFEGNNIYFSADKEFKWLGGLKLIAGTGSQRFNMFFFGISYPAHPVLDLMAEYDGGDYNAGVRLKLSTNVNFDLYLKGLRRIANYPYLNDIIDNTIIFGITYSEVFNFSLAGIL